jgi:hypothetical protein
MVKLLLWLLLVLAVSVLYATVLKGSAQQAQQGGLACCLCVRIPVCLHCVHQPSHAPAVAEMERSLIQPLTIFAPQYPQWFFAGTPWSSMRNECQ